MILIVLDHFDALQQRKQTAFTGSRGALLSKLLARAKIPESQVIVRPLLPAPNSDSKKIYRTKTQASKDPDIIEHNGKYVHSSIAAAAELACSAAVAPKVSVIVPMGELACWALTGHAGVTKYRGSCFEIPHDPLKSIPVIPTLSLDFLQKMYRWTMPVVADLDRARRFCRQPIHEPYWDFMLEPSFLDVYSWLTQLLKDADHNLRENLPPIQIAVDFETAAKQIACVGIATSPIRAICVPFHSNDKPAGYWTAAQELHAIRLLQRIFDHPGIFIIGQNYTYDAYYTLLRLFRFRLADADTMLAQGVLFPGTEKSLDFLSSLYLPWHQYWKDDRKNWKITEGGDRTLWRYNCRDACATWELWPILSDMLCKRGQVEQYNFVMEVERQAFITSARGVCVDKKLRKKFGAELLNQMFQMETELDKYFQPLPQESRKKGAAPWYRSPTYLSKILYEQLGLPPIRRKHPLFGFTADDAALEKIKAKEPLLRPPLTLLSQYRSAGVFYSTFIAAELGEDERLHCSYSAVGTESFRLNSSADPLGEGTNMQNIPA